jgi:hypothetical protein
MAKIQSGQESMLGSSNSGPLLPPLSPGLTPMPDPSTTPEMGPPQSQPREADLRSESLQSTREPLSDKAWYDALVENDVSPLIAQARVRHRRDLPALLKEHPGKLVAYSGAERIAIGGTKRELIEKCMQRGLKNDEFLLEAIVPEDDSVIDATMWTHI